MTSPTTTDLEELTVVIARLATDAGERLLSTYTPASRPADLTEFLGLLQRNDRIAGDGLRDALHELVPAARFVDGKFETSALPDGDWWVVDDTEGNINHVHGLPDWGVSIALMRDGAPVVAVFRQPVGDRTYTATRGAGAFLNGDPLRISRKQGLELAIVGTGQAEVGQTATYGRIGDSITTMLSHALLVKASVPSTFPLLLVAAGNMDAFWQFQPTLPGVAVGWLMITEAGGVVTTISGDDWTAGSDTILVGAPGVHPAAGQALSVLA